jgi:hypothetical protein
MLSIRNGRTLHRIEGAGEYPGRKGNRPASIRTGANLWGREEVSVTPKPASEWPEIRNAVLALVFEGGYEAATVEAMTERAGISRARFEELFATGPTASGRSTTPTSPSSKGSCSPRMRARQSPGSP